MKSENQAGEFIREIRFESDDFYNREIMIDKLGRLIGAWGEDLLRNRHIDHVPDSESDWLYILERDIYGGDLHNQWDFYLVCCLIFFVLLQADIERDFLLQPYNVQGQPFQGRAICFSSFLKVEPSKRGASSGRLFFSAAAFSALAASFQTRPS